MAPLFAAAAREIKVDEAWFGHDRVSMVKGLASDYGGLIRDSSVALLCV